MTFNRDTQVSVFRFKESTKNVKYTTGGGHTALTVPHMKKNLIQI